MRQGSPFGIVPTSAVFDQRLTPAVLRVLLALATYADENRVCYPSQKTIGDRLGISRQAVAKSIEQLVAVGYLEVVHQFREDKGKSTNRYRIIFDQEPTLPMQPDVASPTQHHVAPMQPDVASHATYRLHPHATSEVALTDHIEQTTIRNREDRESSAALGADAPGGGANLASLLSEVTQAAELTAEAKKLERVVRLYLPALGADRIIVEAGKAAEWIAEHPKRKMNLRFLDGWLTKAAEPRPLRATGTSDVIPRAMREPPPMRISRGGVPLNQPSAAKALASTVGDH